MMFNNLPVVASGCVWRERYLTPVLRGHKHQPDNKSAPDQVRFIIDMSRTIPVADTEADHVVDMY